MLWITEVYTGSMQCFDQEEEVAMTLTILDPRSGQTVTLQVKGIPAPRRAIQCQVSTDAHSTPKNVG